MTFESAGPQKPSPSRIPAWVWGALVAIALLALGVELIAVRNTHKVPEKELPVLAQVPEFSFTSETGTSLTKSDLAGKVWVADFIFTRCAGPCPLMTDKMRKLQSATANLGDVRLISVSVDPGHDTPGVLSEYAARFGWNPDQWSFLTGDPTKIENFITKGMLLGLSKDGEGLPVHSQKFVVVDREGNVRAYHDLEDPALIPNVLSDVEALRREPSPRKEKP